MRILLNVDMRSQDLRTGLGFKVHLHDLENKNRLKEKKEEVKSSVVVDEHTVLTSSFLFL